MIYGELAIILNLLSLTAFSVLLIVIVVSIFSKIKVFTVKHHSASSRRRILWLVALSPWIIALFAATLALLSGSQYAPFPGAFDLFHWHHSQEFLFNSWHGLSLAFAFVYVSFLVIRNVNRLIQISRQTNLLHILADQDNDGFYQLDVDAPAAFTAGYSHPRCYITSALRNQLDQEEYDIVHLHEKEHARRYDPLKKWLFQLLIAIFPFGLFHHLNQSMVLAMEQNADSAVSRLVKDKSRIAETLLKVRRLTLIPFDTSLEESAVCHYGQDHIQERISYLLSDEKQKPFPVFQVIVATIVMSTICAFSADAFHHVIEYSFSH